MMQLRIVMCAGMLLTYLEVGVGYQWARMSGLHLNGIPTGFPAFSSDDTTGAISYQFILGGAVPIPAVRGLAMTAEYRFLALAH
jgi:OmpA-OmpF porin, OOP family